MKRFFAMIFLMASSFAFADVASDFVKPLMGEHVLQGEGCGKISIAPLGQYVQIHGEGFNYLMMESSVQKVSLKGNTLSLSYEETDNAWPNLKDWEKEEITIKKDSNGDLEAIKFRRGWGKPFYLSNVTKVSCQR